MQKRLQAVAAACALGVVLVACTSTSATPSAAGAGEGSAPPSGSQAAPPNGTGSPGGSVGAIAVPDPCSILTQAQVAGVLGIAVEAGVANSNHGCAFTYNDPANGLNTVTATVSDNVLATEVTKDCQAPSSSGLTVTPISGVGDVACTVDGGILGTHITFATRGLGFEVSVLAFGTLKPQFASATAEGMEKALALLVVAKV